MTLTKKEDNKHKSFIDTVLLSFFGLWLATIILGLTFVYGDSVIEEGLKWLKTLLESSTTS